MPRRSASSYVPVHNRPKATGRKILPPDELDAEQREIFERVRDSLPTTWFHECNAQLLAEYAVAVAARRLCLKRWNEARSGDDRTLERQATAALLNGSQLILQLSKAMRLAQLSVKPQMVSEHKDVAAPARVWGVKAA